MNDEDRRVNLAISPFRTAGLFSLLCILFASASIAAPRTYDLELVRSGLDAPRDLTHAGDDRLFIALRDGRVVFVENGGAPVTFLDIRDRVVPSTIEQGELGLLSVAFHPNYAQNGFFFVVYTDASEDSWISRFSRQPGNPNRADPSSERRLLRVEQITFNHNVNHLRFGPDGMLYVATGDGGFQSEPRCTPQEGNNLLGKILRLDVDQNVNATPYHGIPVDNPFLGPDGIRDEIWAMGLRNPWRISFDRQTGDLFIGDPGHSGGAAREEINFEPAGSPGGRNYGWKMMEGLRCRGSSANCAGPLPACGSNVYTSPLFDYDHSIETRCAVVGGYVYRGTTIPSLVGVYVFGDFCGQMWATSEVDGFQPIAMAPVLGGLVSFGEDGSGELYVATLGGELYRIVGGDTSDAMAGRIAIVSAPPETLESAVPQSVVLARIDGSDGEVSVRVVTSGGSATPGVDYLAVDQRVTWADGEDGVKFVEMTLVDDSIIEGDETVELRLEGAAGGVGIAEPGRASFTIVDDDLPSVCVEDTHTLCLNEGRFSVQVFWRTPQAREGLGTAIPITEDGGWYWFFRATNPEVFIKILDGCTINNHFWVFAGGMTDVETRMTVVDTSTGALRVYESGQSQVFGTIRDTRAFATCP